MGLHEAGRALSVSAKGVLLQGVVVPRVLLQGVVVPRVLVQGVVVPRVMLQGVLLLGVLPRRLLRQPGTRRRHQSHGNGRGVDFNPPARPLKLLCCLAA